MTQTLDAINAELFAVRAQAIFLKKTGYYNTGINGRLPLPGTQEKMDELCRRYERLTAAYRTLKAA